MKLIIGLGNPGDEYKLTRHNMGFLVLEEFAKANSIKVKTNRHFNAVTGEGVLGGEDIYLAMPQTFLNLSGHSVKLMLNWFKIDAKDMFVVVDDVALAFSSLRIRPKGSSGGHKGLRSIIDSTGTQEFSRMRMGILGRKNIRDLSSYVLDRFTKAELKKIPEILDTASQACGCWIREGANTAMNKFNNYGG